MNPKTILMTGATGFIGQHLVPKLLASGHDLKVIVRDKNIAWPKGVTPIAIEDIASATFDESCKNIDVVIHLAGLAHINNKINENRFISINAEATKNLAQAAARQGVKRFLLLSSIAVCGNISITPFKEADQPNPQNAYARSKHLAEIYVSEISKANRMETIIIRPPLVYGKGAGGNFQAFVKLVKKGVPLPLGLVANKRTLCNIDHLTDFIGHAVHYETAGNENLNEIFHVADKESISTCQMAEMIGQGLGRKVLCLPVPVTGLKLLGAILGKKDMMEKLLGSLEVDVRKAEQHLGWAPKISTAEGIKVALKSCND